MPTFKTLREANRARQMEWDPKNQISLSYRGMELAGEVGELLNVLKKIERERMGLGGSRASTKNLLDELGDAYICLDLIAEELGLSPSLVTEAIRNKFNETSEARGFNIFLEE